VIYERGGTILGSSRGGFDLDKIIGSLVDHGVNQVWRTLPACLSGVPAPHITDAPLAAVRHRWRRLAPRR
jgi:hypothetical protein